MFRKPVVWILFAIVAALCVLFTAFNFSKAFPIVSLDLRMDRGAALESARQLAATHGWGPEGYRQAASFGLDGRVRDFVELEGGGKDAFTRMMSEGLFSAYRWRVRHFRQGETNEAMIRFTPAGEPYGFREILPEDQPGATLNPDEARAIAERAATESWSVDLSAYELVEQSQEERPGGRVDHTFVYERPDVAIGEGRYRLRLVVSGDRFTELTHFVKVPEAFDRRYEAMRSANEAIGAGSVVATVLLYLIGGCGVGLFLLLRKRWVLWKKAFYWGFFISLLQALATLNAWPLAWMGYDTALSMGNFALQRTLVVLAQFLGLGSLLAISFMAAESLTRRAFPRHIQFWRLWSRPVAGSAAVLGRTVSGYLLVAVFMAYDVALYLFAHDNLGWWTPSDALYDPDVLAHYVPGLSSVAISLQAGFWEECLFRAVPLACAALIGQRLGGRRFWIVGVMILQAFIFGGGHAPYATQPSYARVAELIIPSVGFGLLYMWWGLLPAIVLHFAVDVVWFAVPLFVSKAPGIWVQQLLVVLATLVPLGVVLLARARSGRWTDVGEGELNAAWAPPAPRAAQRPATVERSVGLTPLRRGVLLALGVVGFVVWLLVTDFRTDAPPLGTGRTGAVAASRSAFEQRGVQLPEIYREMSNVTAGVGADDRFVWQEGGPGLYGDLIGRYITPPLWSVRYARFEGDVAERAEQYQVWVDGSGEVVRFRHTLAEATPGSVLLEAEARARANTAIEDSYGLDAANLREVSAEPSKLPERTDWTFTYSDDASFPLDEGEARLSVEIAGDEVVDMSRFVHVPEEWLRAERDRRTTAQTVQALCTGIVVAAFVIGLIFAIVVWSRGRFAAGVFLGFGLLLLAVNTIDLLNSWPSVVFSFSTAQPFALQAALFVGFGLLIALLIAAAVGLCIGLVHRLLPEQRPAGNLLDSYAGVSLGLLVAGLAALLSFLAPAREPIWGNFDAAGAIVPVISAALGPVFEFITATTLSLLVFLAADRLTAAWSRRRLLLILLALPAGWVVTATYGSIESFPQWLATGAIAGGALLVAYTGLLRFDWTLIPPAIAGLVILDVIRAGISRPFPGAYSGAWVAVILVAALGACWFSLLRRPGG
jgi:hypothetical protein